MADTQWPRFIVFQQAQPNDPFVHNGSVHAPDIEMALLNARDVFARRPEAVAIWVVPADQITSRTREELAAQPLSENKKSVGTKTEFCVFGKLIEQAQAELLGTLKATSPEDALALAVRKYADRNVLRWWIFPEGAAVKSLPGDVDPMFKPGKEKTFKDQAEYPVVTMMRQLRSKGRLGRNE